MLSKSLLEKLEQEIESFQELESRLASLGASQDLHLLKKLTREHSFRKRRVIPIQSYLQKYYEWKEVKEILAKEKEKDLREMASEEVDTLRKDIEEKKREIELLLLPPDENEGRSIFIEIRAGTGGEEAALFVSNLMRMYLRYAEKEKLKVEIININPTELGGYKEVIFRVSGEKAYSVLHQEAGTHRVQRIPSTESNGRIHTSAVTVAVLPEREESEVKIDEGDLEIDVYRASGAGGQHVNKTESAVRITHVPSGIVVACQDERSQLKNKNKAMGVLRSRLGELYERESLSQANEIKKEQIKSGDRSERVRTYNFPQGRVTDHRISYTAHNLEALMEGDMYSLLQSLVEAEAEKKIHALE